MKHPKESIDQMTITFKVKEDMVKELVSTNHTKVKAILEEGQKLFQCKLCDYSCKKETRPRQSVPNSDCPDKVLGKSEVFLVTFQFW